MKPSQQSEKEPLPKAVEEKCRRRLKAEKEKERPIFFGFGMFGMVGWSVAVPAVLGTLLGRWLDSRGLAVGQVSWTLSGLLLGLLAGGIIAWQWVNRERQR